MKYVRFKEQGVYPALDGQIGQVVEIRPSRWGDSEDEISVNIVAPVNSERFIWETNSSCLDAISQEEFTTVYQKALATYWSNQTEQER